MSGTLLYLAMATAQQAPLPSLPEAWNYYQQALSLYDRAQFDEAAGALQQAIAQQPACSLFHHWLGKAYGRQAEQASWFAAMGLARRTGQALEHAVELDPNNLAALHDLARFYVEAPGFLGGDEAGAETLRQRIAELEQQQDADHGAVWQPSCGPPPGE